MQDGKQMQPTAVQKKVLFVMESLQVNGASKSLLALLNAVCDEYEISLFLFSHDGNMVRELPAKVRLLSELDGYHALSLQMKVAVCEYLKRGRIGLAWFRFRVFLQRALRRPFTQWNDLPEIPGEWDLVCSYADGFPAQVVIEKTRGANKVLWVHEDYENNPKPPEVLECFRKADRIACASRDAARHLKNLLGEEVFGRCFVVHNIVDSQEILRSAKSESVELPGDNARIVSVGRVSPEKGYECIPKILEELKEQEIEADWSIIGAGLVTYKNAILSEAETIGVSGMIHFLGEKSNPHSYTIQADCFVQLSRHEGWCMTITEALCLGVPVVARDLPVFSEQVVNGENGFLARDAKSFADAILRVLGGELKGKSTPENGLCSRDSVKKEFERLTTFV